MPMRLERLPDALQKSKSCNVLLFMKTGTSASAVSMGPEIEKQNIVSALRERCGKFREV
jgi:hypothetical protein